MTGSSRGTKAPRRHPPHKRTESAETTASEIDAHSGDVNFMTSLARGLAVIRAFSGDRRALTIADVSRAVGIPRAAVRRCLYTLERLGYASSDEQGFSLRPKILTLGYAYLSSSQLAASAQPLLDRVSTLAQESCSLATLSGDEIAYVARATTSKRIMSVDISVGTRFPAYCTSMGRVLLAELSPGELEAFLGRVRLKAFTERTVTSREKLRQLLQGVRRNGCALVDQELEVGLRSIAVPVRGASGKVVAAMNVGAQAARFGLRDMETKFLPLLREAAEELAAVLRV